MGTKCKNWNGGKKRYEAKEFEQQVDNEMPNENGYNAMKLLVKLVVAREGRRWSSVQVSQWIRFSPPA